jgi:hypothetical protein
MARRVAEQQFRSRKFIAASQEQVEPDAKLKTGANRWPHARNNRDNREIGLASWREVVILPGLI